MSEPRWNEMVGAYVLGGLEADERRAFEERLHQDVELQAEVARHHEVVAGLAHALPTVQPPAGLKQRVLDAARSTPQKTPALQAMDGGADASKPTRRPASAPSLLPWFAAAAALVVAVGLGVLMQQAEDRRQVAERELATTEAAVAELETELAERDSLLATFLGPDVRTASLSATGQPPSARLFWNTSTATLLVAAFDLPPAEKGRTYQLWGIPEGENPVSLGTFQTGPDGTAVFRRQAPEGLDFQLGAVSEEPAGGSPQPTTTPILVGSWTQAQ